MKRTMFYVDRLQSVNDTSTSIATGTVFGAMHQAVLLRATCESIPEPVSVRLTVTEDRQRGACELSLCERGCCDVEVTFFNPNSSRPSGIPSPVILLKRGDSGLGFMFHIDRLTNSRRYRCTYEFYLVRMEQLAPSTAP